MPTPDFLTIGISLVVGIAASYITFRLRFERFHAKDEEREKNLWKWRNQISRDIDFLKISASLPDIALLKQSLDALVKRVDAIDKYTEDLKHMHIDPFEREVAKLDQRVGVLEKK